MFPDFLHESSVFKRTGLFLITTLFFPFMIVSCANEIPVIRATEIFHVEVTATPPPPTTTTVPTQTPTITPTPTATAPPMQISGDPLSDTFAEPTPAPGAYCGFIDTFDFPLNPPDGEGIRGGQDFGVFRSRYGKYHAGEDWGFRGGSAFGDPVFAIGHGTVTYADGLGWGPDQGAVIIRHYFPDGTTVLSFYGHLDPPSVTLVPGTCIERGEQVGTIGRPRTSPHLHFEIRTTMPFVPGPGYWIEDPTTAGWLPPSSYIAQQRMEKIAGTVWVRSDLTVDQLLGFIEPETIVVREGSRLLGVYAPAGGIIWSHELQTRPAEVVLSERTEEIFVKYINGDFETLRLPEQGEALSNGTALFTLTELEASISVQTELIAAPWGGVVLLSTDAITALNSEGIILWQQPLQGAVLGWVEHNGALALTTVGEQPGLWVFGGDGLLWDYPGDFGTPFSGDEGIYLLSRDNLSLIQDAGQSPQDILRLSEGFRAGQLVQTPDGGLMLLHADPTDERLIYIRNGEVGWDRSIIGQVPSGGRLITAGEEVYLVTQVVNGNAETIELLRIDIDGRSLERVFVGGTRDAARSRLMVDALDTGELVIRFGESSLLVFDGSLTP